MNATRHPRRHLDYIAHMLEAAQLARGYVKAMNKDTFLACSTNADTCPVMLNLVVIGEALDRQKKNKERGHWIPLLITCSSCRVAARTSAKSGTSPKIIPVIA